MAKVLSTLEEGVHKAGEHRDQKLFWHAFINSKFCFSKASWRQVNNGALQTLEISEIIEDSVNLILFNRALGGHLVKLLPNDVTLVVRTPNGQITVSPHTVSQLKRCIFVEQQLSQTKPEPGRDNQLGIA